MNSTEIIQNNIKNNGLINKLIAGLLVGLPWATVEAAEPLWTIIPAPGNNPTQTVLANETVAVLYLVENQSGRPKKLVMQPLPGIAQPAPCELTPKGQAGSRCDLELVITGSELPSQGVQGGPILCQANLDGSPNSNQCYQPSSANSLHITTAPAEAQISISNPVPQERIVTVTSILPLSLEITNEAGSTVNANAITVINKSACPNLTVDDSNCTSVAPGGTCTLELTSNSPYVPCMITIRGSNTDSPTTLVAFSYLGGLVFEESGGSGKVVVDSGQGFIRTWTDTYSDIVGATSPDNGASNTDAIVADAACASAPSNCAAQGCRDMGIEWYLPAINELSAVHSALCPNADIPCNFGGFLLNRLYWSSSQVDSGFAYTLRFPLGNMTSSDKNSQPLRTRCVRAFAP